MKSCGRVSALLIPLATVMTLIHTFAPRTADMVAIYVIPKVVNSQLVQETIPRETAEFYGLLKSRLTGDSNNALHVMVETLADTVTNYNDCVSQRWQETEEDIK